MLERIRELIGEKLGNLGFEVLPAESAERGYFSTNAAFALAKQMNTSPLEAAKELEKYLEDKGVDFFSKIEVAEPGFLNLWVKPEVIREEFEKMVKEGPEWGKPCKARKDSVHGPRGKVIVEYSQPNIAKPMHVGHLRSTIIGDALANILEFAGYDVIRWNYLGDWGTQFGNVIAAYKLWGDKKEIERAPVEVLAGLYAKFHAEMQNDPSLEEKGREEFRKLETGDEENRKLWEWFREESIKELNKIYDLLGIKFDEWIGESFYGEDLPPLVDALIEKGIAKESEGAIIIPLEKYNLPPALIRKSDEGTLYLTRDIANLNYRLEEYKASSVLYVVDNGQSLHFRQLFAIADILGMKGNFHHIKFGLVLGEDLKRLSTRAGRHIALLEVINEAIERAREIMEEKEVDMDDKEKEEVAQIVGIGALKYNDLSQNRVADIAFDWDKMLSLQGNSAPYLQYTYARLKSILRKAEAIDPVRSRSAEGTATAALGRPASNGIEKESDLRLILKLAFFPEVIEAVSENYLPHQLANYLYDLARAINDYYEKEPILKARSTGSGQADEKLRGARLHLVKIASEILRTGLGLLGIRAPEKM